MGDVAKVLLAVALVCAHSGFAAEYAPQPKYFGDAVRGQAIAAQWCAECHRVGGPSLNDQVPSFNALSASDRSESEIRGFLLQPHRPMPPLALSNQQVEDLIAYLRGLAPKR